MRGIVATMIAAGALFLIAGCGGDDAPLTSVTTESQATTTEDSGGEDFAVAADARCAEAYAAIANTSATSAAQELAITEGLLDGLQDLDPPNDPALDSFFSALEDQIATLQEIETAMASGDTSLVASLEAELETERSSALAAADEFGLDDCGQAGTSLPDDATTGEPVTPPSATTPAAPVTPTPTTPAPAPTEPAPAPVTPPATGGGTGAGSGSGGTGSTGGSGSGGSGGGISP